MEALSCIIFRAGTQEWYKKNKKFKCFKKLALLQNPLTCANSQHNASCQTPYLVYAGAVSTIDSMREENRD